MTEHALMCPQCNAPLTPSRFASVTVCSYCGATVQLDDSFVSAERFHKAFRVWNAPQTYQISSWISLGDRHWALGKQIARGEVSDVYAGQRARWPTELVIIKILRDRKDVDMFDNEWGALQNLHQSKASGAERFTLLIPQTVLHGDISAGLFVDKRVSIFRWISGFQHTFEDVMQAYPQGISPRASIWVWRRMLEVLCETAPCAEPRMTEAAQKAIKIVGYTQELIVVSSRSMGSVRKDNPELFQGLGVWLRRGALRWIDVGSDLDGWVVQGAVPGASSQQVSESPGKSPAKSPGKIGNELEVG